MNLLIPFLTFHLFTAGLPNTNGVIEPEYTNERGCVYQTTDPRFDFYRPNGDKTVPCLLVLPGGGYGYTSCGNEGDDVVNYFVPNNVAVAVLKYRMPNMHAEVPLTDASEAMRVLRDSAEAWHLDPARIGVMGFSAGGHLAASLLTLFPDEKARPDFGLLIYPVISMESDITHKGTCKRLLGDAPSDEQRLAWSTDKQVTANTPRTLLVACQDDKSVSVENSIRFYQALTANHVEAEMYLLAVGAHGFGWKRTIPNQELFHTAILRFIQQ